MLIEKGIPHSKLIVVKAMAEVGKVAATASAFQGAQDLGINDLDGMCAVVMNLAPSNFFKSMTTFADHRILQDVYRTHADGKDVYLKLPVIDDVLIVSFKEQ